MWACSTTHALFMWDCNYFINVAIAFITFCCFSLCVCVCVWWGMVQVHLVASSLLCMVVCVCVCDFEMIYLCED